MVTGGAGFLGSFVVEKLQQMGCPKIVVPRSAEYDLRESEAISRLYDEMKPNMIIHLAAVVGGIGANQKNPGKYFYDNAIMGIQLLEYARRHNVDKFVMVGTICAYPKYTPVPFKEDDLWNGYPEETNAPYGIAKKAVLVQSQAYREQYGYNSIYLLPVNLYGPRDNFDLESSHVIPALIRKCVEARNNGLEKIVLWGDGTPTREFLYVEDAAQAIVMAAENYNGDLPVNLGTEDEVPIRELAELICNLTGFKGNIEWDITRPNGQPRRCLDTARAFELFGFKAQTGFEDGLKKTIQWFEQNCA